MYEVPEKLNVTKFNKKCISASAQPFPHQKYHQYWKALNFITYIMPFELHRFPILYFYL